MTAFENVVPSQGIPKKHFYGVPKGIASFTDEQIDAWGEKLYDQMVRDLGIEVNPKLLNPLASTIKTMEADHE